MIYSNPEFILLFTLTLAAFAAIRAQGPKFAVLLAASLLFYLRTGAIDTLIFLSVVAFSWIAVWLAWRYPARRGLYLFLGILVMTGHLFFWKYAGWVVGGIQRVCPDFFGGRRLELPLPVGISFFTLQGIAYLADFWRQEARFMKFREYLLFKSFFAQLVAGPIVRVPQLLPQLERLPRPTWSGLAAGLSLFTLGFFKKLFISEHLAPFVDSVFSQPANYTRMALLTSLLAYSVQIWADFSGYTDMGRGAARMLGIVLPENFLSPYLARSPSEYWQRWHITLSQWIRDYIYIPLALSFGHGSALRLFLVAMFTMGVSGLWHGAALTFVLWGLYHGILLVLEQVLKRSAVASAYERAVPRSLRPVGTWSVMMLATIGGWLIFRAQDTGVLAGFMRSLISGGGSLNKAPFAAYVPICVFLCAAIQVVSYYSFERGDFVVLTWLKRRLLPTLSPASLDRAAYTCGWGIAAVIVATLFFRKVGFTTPFIYFSF